MIQGYAHERFTYCKKSKGIIQAAEKEKASVDGKEKLPTVWEKRLAVVREMVEPALGVTKNNAAVPTALEKLFGGSKFPLLNVRLDKSDAGAHCGCPRRARWRSREEQNRTQRASRCHGGPFRSVFVAE